ncbi:rhomboid-domain-containing protein [Pilatotrama ljubarskyi]|nr:rhomboid-domain-containing protein [Pilatotrama ljubarskyi]
MLWTLRPLRAWPLPCRPPQRSFSFTRIRRLPRVVEEGAPKPPLFREEVAKAKKLPSFTDAVRTVPIGNQVLFVIAGTLGALAVGAHLTNYDLFKWWAYIVSTPQTGLRKDRPPSSEELARARYYAFGRKLQAGLATLKNTMEQLPETLKAMTIWSYVQVFQPILNASEGKRMCWLIGAVNCAVFMAWRIPRLNQFMMRSFTHNPLSGRSYTLLTAVFSHENFFHLAFNCMALASFGAAASQQLMVRTKAVEQERGVLSEPSPKWHLLALFISAGLFASLVSHVSYARWRYPRLIARLKSEHSSPSTLRSASSAASSTASAGASESTLTTAMKKAKEGEHCLGSSGAIYALFAITALGFPDAEITLVIPPWFPINIQTGFAAILAFDILGVLRGWRMFDHYAHLGGAAFGAFWYAYGAKIWYAFREWDLPVAYFFHGGALKSAKASPSSSTSRGPTSP